MNVRVALAVVAVAALLVGCGIPSDDEPRAMSDQDVPFDLLSRDNPTPSTTEPGPASAVVDVFLVGDERLVGAPRELATPIRVEDRIRSLLAGLSDEEAELGLRTAVPSGTELLGTELAANVLTIDLSEDFLSVQGSEQQTAVAQLVFTTTEAEGIDGVRFALEGELVQVPTDDGSLSAQPLTRDSYPSLAA